MYGRGLELQVVRLQFLCRRLDWQSVLSSRGVLLQPSHPTIQDRKSQRNTSAPLAHAQWPRSLKKMRLLLAVGRPSSCQHHQYQLCQSAAFSRPVCLPKHLQLRKPPQPIQRVTLNYSSIFLLAIGGRSRKGLFQQACPQLALPHQSALSCKSQFPAPSSRPPLQQQRRQPVQPIYQTTTLVPTLFPNVIPHRVRTQTRYQ